MYHQQDLNYVRAKKVVILWVKTHPLCTTSFEEALKVSLALKDYKTSIFGGYQHFSLGFEIKESWKPLFRNLLKSDILCIVHVSLVPI